MPNYFCGLLRKAVFLVIEYLWCLQQKYCYSTPQKTHFQFNPYLGVNFSQIISDENIKNTLSKRISPHCAGSCISYFSVYNNCVEFSASGLGTGLNRDPFKAETTYSHDPSLTSHLSLGLIHPCTITAVSMCSS